MTSIRRCRDDDREAIVAIINTAAEAYRGVIPADRWHEPYMPQDEFDREIAAGVVFWCYEADGKLAGVMGLQSVRRCQPYPSRLRPAGPAEARHRWRSTGTSAANEHAAYPGWHVGSCPLGDQLLPAPRLRVGCACAQDFTAQDVLERAGSADRGFSCAGQPPTG